MATHGGIVFTERARRCGRGGLVPEEPQTDAWVRKAFELELDATKTLITLSSAILALTITLGTDVKQHIELLGATWIAFLISLLGGVWELRGLGKELERAATDAESPTLRAFGIIVPSRLQNAAFGVGTALLVYYGLVTIRSA